MTQDARTAVQNAIAFEMGIEARRIESDLAKAGDRLLARLWTEGFRVVPLGGEDVAHDRHESPAEPRTTDESIADEYHRLYLAQSGEYRLCRARLMDLANEAIERDEAFKKLADLMDEADDALDKDTYEQKRHDDFDTPDDGEWWIRAGTERKCIKVFAEIDRIRKSMDAAVKARTP